MKQFLFGGRRGEKSGVVTVKAGVVGPAGVGSGHLVFPGAVTFKAILEVDNRVGNWSGGNGGKNR
jgi:hypothetical protein